VHPRYGAMPFKQHEIKRFVIICRCKIFASIKDKKEKELPCEIFKSTHHE
jgi:hypothetical protein